MEQDFEFALWSLVPRVGLKAMCWGHSFLGLGCQVSTEVTEFENPFEDPLMRSYRTVSDFVLTILQVILASMRKTAKRNGSRVSVQLWEFKPFYL